MVLAVVAAAAAAAAAAKTAAAWSCKLSSAIVATWGASNGVKPFALREIEGDRRSSRRHGPVVRCNTRRCWRPSRRGRASSRRRLSS